MAKAVNTERRELDAEMIEAIKSGLVNAGLAPTIYRFTFAGESYVFRPLYRKDWHDIQSWMQLNQGNIRKEVLDQKVCQKALIWPEEVFTPGFWDNQLAGFPGTLAKKILSRSGFIDEDEDQTNFLRIDPLTVINESERPTQEVIDSLKLRFPRWKLNLVLVDTEYYIVRPISRNEWKDLTSDNPDDADLAIATRAVIWTKNSPSKPDFTDQVAGTVRTLSEVILTLSCFNQPPTMVEEL